MDHRRKIITILFMSTGIVAALFLGAELVFQLFGKTICPTEGCEIINRQSRFGDISIVLIGLVTFSLLSVLSFLEQYRNRGEYGRYINLILVASLAAEGFFVGYQAFSIHAVCVVCLITFSFFLLLGTFRLLAGEKEVIGGFLSFAGVFALFYLILPAGTTVRLPEEELVLFYSEDCRFCAEVTEKIKANNVNVSHLLIGQYAGLLKDIGIEHVPTLLVNKKNQKLFLTGRDAIDQYLFPEPKVLEEKQTTKGETVQQIKKPSPKARPASRGPAMLWLPQDSPSKLLIPPADGGMCIEGKEEEKKCD